MRPSETTTAPAGPAVDGSTVSPSRRRVAISVGAIAVLLAALDAYVVVTLLTPIAYDLGIELNNIQQATPIVTGFLLGYVAGMPLLGGLSDRLGRRAVIQWCLIGFLVGSIVTASSLDLYNWLLPNLYEWFGVDTILEGPFQNALPILIGGRVIQGVAGGALLPVTMALVADLWNEARRPAVLGTVGAAQELGSVLGPLYGAWIAAAFAPAAIEGRLVHPNWQAVFWINVPLVLVCMLAVQVALPGRKAQPQATGRARVDLFGAILLAAGLCLLVFGLYSPDTTKSAIAPHGEVYIGIGAAVLLVFALWEWKARSKLIDLSNSPKGPFFSVMGASFIAGAALMVTLIDVSLLAQSVFLVDDPNSATNSAKILVRFLVALPVGAVLGGFIVPRIGLRAVTVLGFVISTGAYVLIGTWSKTVREESHDLLVLSLPKLDTDLALAGLGLGLVIAPLSAAVLRLVPATQHGVASAMVVLARTMGMLIGLAGLTGWGIYRFYQLIEKGDIPPERILEVYQDAVLKQYHEIFFGTAILCALAAIISSGIAFKKAPQQA